jgi:hypothetical protein
LGGSCQWRQCQAMTRCLDAKRSDTFWVLTLL